jgi:G3E family GTPase
LTSDPREGRMRLTILGGFLGSGKSTWLRHHLHDGLLRNALVVVNEAAGTPVDDTLLVGPMPLRVLAGGCACCETRPALVMLLRDICDDRVGGKASAPRIDRIVLETSGLADPGRIVDSIVTDPVLQHHIVVGDIIVTVDALHGLGQIRDEDLGRRQIEIADRLVVTKVDAAEPEPLRRLVATLRMLNPGATLSGSVMGSPTDLPDPSGMDPENLPVVGAQTMAPIEAATLNLGEPLDWPALTVWLSALIHARGDDILRIKGVVRTPRGRLLLQSVRKVVQSPEILPDEPATSDTRDGSLVLIGRRFTADALARSLKAFGIESGLTIQPRMEMSESTRAGPPGGVASRATDPSLSRFRAS